MKLRNLSSRSRTLIAGFILAAGATHQLAQSEPAQAPTLPADSACPARVPGCIRQPLRWGRKAIKLFGQSLLIACASLLIYCSNLSWPVGGLILAVAFGVFAIWAIWGGWRRLWRWALVGIRMDRRKAGDLRFTMELITPNNDQQFLIERGNATLTNLIVFSPATPT